MPDTISPEGVAAARAAAKLLDDVAPNEPTFLRERVETLCSLAWLAGRKVEAEAILERLSR